MRRDRATARRVAEALYRESCLHNTERVILKTGVLISNFEYAIDVILRALTPAKPPVRTKRGKGKL